MAAIRLVVISGRSGSGKTTALHVLEDAGFTCIDNLPAGLLPALFAELKTPEISQKIAVGIDARNIFGDLQQIPNLLKTLNDSGVSCEVIFLDASDSNLVKRFSETRRKHPLSSDKVNLKEAIAQERLLLDPIASIANRQIDTSFMTLHQLRDVIKKQVVPERDGEMAILFQSFGFKKGVPVDADFVFDVRCLPNPYWKHELRQYTGNQKPIIEFLESQTEVASMLADIIGFLTRWLPKMNASNRSYLTIAIGCTGGHHRSVYLANRLQEHFAKEYANVQTLHRELATSSELLSRADAG